MGDKYINIAIKKDVHSIAKTQATLENMSLSKLINKLILDYMQSKKEEKKDE